LPSSMETIRAAHEVDQLLEAAVERNRIHSRRVRDDARRPPGSDGGGSSSGSGIA